MLQFDIPTLMLVIVVLTLTLGVGTALISSGSALRPLRWWAGALLLYSVSYLLLMQRGQIPDVLTIVFANITLSGAMALNALAIARLTQIAAPRWLFWGPPLVVAVVFSLLINAFNTRAIAANAIYCAQTLLMVILLLRQRKRWSPALSLLIATFSTMVAIFLIRLVTYAFDPAPPPTLTAQGMLQTMTYLLAIITLLMTTLGFFFLVKERADRQIEESKHVLTAIIDSTEETVSMLDCDGTLLAINRVGAQRFSSTPDKMIGSRIGELMPPEVAEPRIAAIRHVALTGSSETLVDQRAGHTYRLTFYPVQGESERVVVYGADITEALAVEETLRKRLEETLLLNKQLAEAQSQLLQSEKMAAIGQLAAGVAHEINNPISFVYSNLGTLQRYLEDLLLIADAYEQALNESAAAGPAIDAARAVKTGKDFDYLRQDAFQLLVESKDGLQRVKKIVADLKAFSRPGESPWQWADLHSGLDSTLNIVWNELKYKCKVTKDYGELPQVYCLPSQLNQVFMSLLVNAANAIPEKGEVTLRTGRQNEEVFVAISDTGSGIAPEHLNRIFEPFFSTKPIGKGIGLGLSLAYGIVQKHQGRIEVTSALGRGSTFTVWLPITAQDSNGTVPPIPIT